MFRVSHPNTCCGSAKEPSHRDGSFEYPQHLFCQRDKTMYANFFQKSLLFYFVSHWQFNFQYLTGDRGLLQTDASMARESQEDMYAKL